MTQLELLWNAFLSLLHISQFTAAWVYVRSNLIQLDSIGWYQSIQVAVIRILNCNVNLECIIYRMDLHHSRLLFSKDIIALSQFLWKMTHVTKYDCQLCMLLPRKMTFVRPHYFSTMSRTHQRYCCRINLFIGNLVTLNSTHAMKQAKKLFIWMKIYGWWVFRVPH